MNSRHPDLWSLIQKMSLLVRALTLVSKFSFRSLDSFGLEVAVAEGFSNHSLRAKAGEP